MRLFLYGTLKRNHCRHFAVQHEEFVGEARTVPAYRLFDIGSYPGLVDAPGHGLSIRGEVWNVSDRTLAMLDEVEEVEEGLYERREISLLNAGEGIVQAYFYLRNVDGLRDCGDCWE